MSAPDLTALYRPESTHDEMVAAMQWMIDTGQVWRTSGDLGRCAMGLIEAGDCVLGTVGHLDAYGNYVPSRFEVQPGTKGSVEYAERQRAERDS